MATSEYELFFPCSEAVESRPELRSGVVVEPKWHEVTTTFLSDRPVIYALPSAISLSMAPVVVRGKAGMSIPEGSASPSNEDLRRELWPLLEPAPQPRSA